VVVAEVSFAAPAGARSVVPEVVVPEVVVPEVVVPEVVVPEVVVPEVVVPEVVVRCRGGPAGSRARITRAAAWFGLGVPTG
jgi:hypothetical protein